MPKNKQQASTRYLISSGPNGKLYVWFEPDKVHLELESGNTVQMSNSELDRLWQCYQGESIRWRNFGEPEVN